MNELLDLYSDILTSANCTVENDGTVIHHAGAEPAPVTIMLDGKVKTLRLPTEGVLRAGLTGDTICFHPACESVFAGQSEVLNSLSGILAIRLFTEIQSCVAALATLAKSTDEHQALNLKQMKAITSIPPVNKTVFNMVHRVIRTTTGVVGDHPLISLQLQRSKSVGDTEYSRTCTMVKHILEGFLDDIKGTDKNKDTVRALYAYVLNSIKPAGSNDKNNPYLESLLELYYHAAVRTNNIRKMLGKHGTIINEIPVAWHDKIGAIAELKAKYLPQNLPGNAGSMTSDAEMDKLAVNVGGIVKPTTSAVISKAVAPMGSVQPTVPTVPSVDPISPAPMGSTAPTPPAPTVNPLVAALNQMNGMGSGPATGYNPQQMTYPQHLQQGIAPQMSMQNVPSAQPYQPTALPQGVPPMGGYR